MDIVKHEDFLMPELVEGRIRLSCYLSDCDDDLELAGWGTGKDEKTVTIYFTLGAAFSSAVERFQMSSQGNAIDEEARPLFNAMRSELVEMIDQIDALRFLAPNTGVKGRERPKEPT